jgi:pyoverdine/dityrosine biosynthesis protein Dit1
MAPIATQSRPETSNGHGVVDVDISQGVLSLTEMLDPKALRTSAHILRVIDRYKLPSSSSTCAKPSSRADEGYLRFLPIIYSHVKASRPICLCLPAFPFKSPNSTRKVLGRLPDKAEEVALAHLNGLCLAIGDLYPPGAKLTIISDGLVYNGTLSFP